MKRSLKAEHKRVVKGTHILANQITPFLSLRGTQNVAGRGKRLKVGTELFFCNCNISLRVRHIGGSMFHHTSVCLSATGNVSANQSSSIRFNQHVPGQEGLVFSFVCVKFKTKTISYFQMDIG